jgi:uncharacterized protein (DUF2252 family)
VAAALEVGTQSAQQVLSALMADHWLHQKGEPKSAQGDAIRKQVTDAFFIDTPEWREQSLTTAMALYAATLRGLQTCLNCPS